MLDNLKNDLRAVTDPEKAAFLPRFFKTGAGQYGEGDKFLGITVPAQRVIAKKYGELPLADIEKLIQSEWHEERLTGLIILVNAYKKADVPTQKEIYDFYLSHTKNINNWDLVDSSAEFIVGPYLENRPEKMKVLTNLANSSDLWEKRIAMISTFDYIKKGNPTEALEIAEILLQDKHDLIQKAVGWMLREIGKRCDQQLLIEFLNIHYKTMPRTSLRYAIEHFSPETRTKYLKGEI
jgi:3-methyladenine DNA glycosylase AlkD